MPCLCPDRRATAVICVALLVTIHESNFGCCGIRTTICGLAQTLHGRPGALNRAPVPCYARALDHNWRPQTMPTYTPILYLPGRGNVRGPDKPTPHAALEWAAGYAKPGDPLPMGTTLRIGADIWAMTADRRFRPVGRRP